MLCGNCWCHHEGILATDFMKRRSRRGRVGKTTFGTRILARRSWVQLPVGWASYDSGDCMSSLPCVCVGSFWDLQSPPVVINIQPSWVKIQSEPWTNDLMKIWVWSPTAAPQKSWFPFDVFVHVTHLQVHEPWMTPETRWLLCASATQLIFFPSHGRVLGDDANWLITFRGTRGRKWALEHKNILPWYHLPTGSGIRLSQWIEANLII